MAAVRAAKHRTLEQRRKPTTVSTAMPRSPDTMNVEDLLAHITGSYQLAHRRNLPELIALARKVEHMHQDAKDVPLGLADALDRIALELDVHMQTEEAVLFRAMRQNIDGVIAYPIAVMRGEHAVCGPNSTECRNSRTVSRRRSAPADHGGSSTGESLISAEPCASRCTSRTKCLFPVSRPERRAASARLRERSMA